MTATRRAIAAPRIFDGHRWHEDAAIIIDGDRVERIAPRSGLESSLVVETLGMAFSRLASSICRSMAAAG